MSIWKNGLTAGLLSFVCCMVLAAIAQKTTGVPEGFPPFTSGPLAAACFGGALLGTAAYFFLRKWFRWANQIMWTLTVLFILVSLALPYRLGYTQSKRFAGATPSAQIVLVCMHLLVGGIVTGFLTRPCRKEAV